MLPTPLHRKTLEGVRVPKIKKDAAVFFAVNLIFLVMSANLAAYGMLSPVLAAANAAAVVLFVAYWISYAFAADGKKYVVAAPLRDAAALSIAAVFTFVVAFLYLNFGYNMQYLLSTPALLFFYVPLYMPPLLAVLLAAYVLRAPRPWRHGKWFAAAMLAVAVALLVFMALSGYIIHRPIPDDEEFLAIAAAKAMVSGTNPYAASFSGALYAGYRNLSVGLPTVSTSNVAIGNMNYPALYFLPFVPFAYSSARGIYSFSYGGILSMLALSAFLAFAAIGWSLPRKLIRYPRYGILAFAIIPLVVSSSVISFLMLAVLVLAYSKLDNPYACILLGIAAAMQEQTWVPVLLMLIFIAKESGVRKSSVQALGALSVFLLANAPFIIESPRIFLRNVFTPVGGYLLPNSLAPLGYLILSQYPLLLPDMNRLFFISIMLSAAAFAYLGKKKLIGVFSLLPLTFLYHAIPAYSSFFVAFAVISASMPENKITAPEARGSPRSAHGIRAALCLTIFAFSTALLIIVIANSHPAYVFSPLKVDNASLSVINGSLRYYLWLTYGNATGGNFSVLTYSYYPSTSDLASNGIYCENVLASRPADANASACDYDAINPNVVQVEGNGKRTEVVLAFNNPNSTNMPSEVGCAFYRSGYFYMCPWAKVPGKG